MPEKRKNTIDDGVPDVGGTFDYSMLIQNPSGKSALMEFIDLRRMERDLLYRNLVWYGFFHPTWEGIPLPEGKTLSWRQLANCMKADRFPTASTWERVAEVTDIAGDRCPLVRIPLPEMPGHVTLGSDPIEIILIIYCKCISSPKGLTTLILLPINKSMIETPKVFTEASSASNR